MQNAIKLIPVLFWLTLATSCYNGKKEYNGAEIYSLDTVKYGKFEIRMRMASGDGVISSFFLFGNNAWKGTSYKWLEIDLEALGKNENLLQTNIITGSSKIRKQFKKLFYSNKQIADSFHIYTLEWTPDYIAWFIDGKRIRNITNSKETKELRSEALTYRFNIWVSSEPFWAGFVDRKSVPASQQIDWIKYYRYTPENKERFKLTWVDEFDYFDKTRWSSGNWTFDRNMATFKPENITVKDGFITLHLTK